MIKFNLDGIEYELDPILSGNKKPELVKLAKFNGLKGYSKLNKQELVDLLKQTEPIVGKKRVRKLDKPVQVTVIELNELSESLPDIPQKPIFELSELKESLPELVLVPKIKKQRINPITELTQKLAEIPKTDQYYDNKASSLKNCYAYRIWLWVTHERTYDEEMERADKLLKERDLYWI